MRLTTALVLLSGASACDLVPECDVDMGALSDFTAGPEERAAYTISGVEDCPGLYAWAITITGHGPDAQRVPTIDWYMDEVAPRLAEMMITTSAYPGGSCNPMEALSLVISAWDWRDTDAIVTTVAERMAVDALAGSAAVVINEIVCAD